MTRHLFNKQIALPSDHGSWVFVISPLLIGLFAADTWEPAQAWMILALFAIFLLRQPASMLVKTLSGRRSKRYQSVAIFWISVFGLIALFGLFQIIRLGYAYLTWLAAPGLVIFSIHLWLVSQRRERRQMGVDLIASGTLALAAPAAFWIGSGGIEPTGWWLWILAWMQSISSIMYAFLRLQQRALKEMPSVEEKWSMGRPALLTSGLFLVVTLASGAIGWLPTFLWLAFLIQFSEAVWGILNPAVRMKPTAIGFRQLAVSTLFTFAFILLW